MSNPEPRIPPLRVALNLLRFFSYNIGIPAVIISCVFPDLGVNALYLTIALFAISDSATILNH